MERLITFITAGFIAILTLPTHSIESEQFQKFSYEDIFDLEYAEDPQFSPNGDSIYYTRNSVDEVSDSRRANIWQITTDGKLHRQLTFGNFLNHSPRLSPNGNNLAFISTSSGSPQIHILELNNGQNHQISQLTMPPSNLQWSPDGMQIAFTTFVPESEKLPFQVPTPPKKAKWAPTPKFIDRNIYRIDSLGYLQKGYAQIFVVSLEGNKPHQLTSGKHNRIDSFAWSANGDSIYFSANIHLDQEIELLNSDIYRVEIKNQEVKQITERFGPDYFPQISPDGTKLAYLGFDDQRLGYHQDSLYIMELNSGGSYRIETVEDRSISSFKWLEDSNRIAYSYDDYGSTKIVIQKLGGEKSLITSDAGGSSLAFPGRPFYRVNFAVSKNADIAYLQANAQRPAELAFIHNGKIRTLTDLNGELIRRREMAKVKEINFKSRFDNRNIQGWIAYPPNFNRMKKYPLLLQIHGGPFYNYGPRFAAEVQLYAAAGYVVLYTNPRGSTSYGHEFANLIHHNYPGQDYDDLISGVDAVIAQEYIDEDQLFATGGSGGGTLTAWLIGKTNRFRAAVAAKPIINWESFVLTSDFSSYFTKYWFSAPPWEQPEEYRRRSPLTYVGNITTPTMLLTGEEDYRTPISETEQFYQALKLNKVDTAMVRLPNASHDIARKPSQLITKVASILYWFEHHKPDPNSPELANN
ncbi:S9 family peptidase [Microbulbifer sp. TRSA007]|uniref:S9 family peptidase n=1 Tax=Microbulbifer sp. TRSA007 TaxID=3243384 RepID=UPI004039E751